jgi:hypothetical protein
MRLVALLFAIASLAACTPSSNAGAVSLAGASVDRSYYCPGGASNAPYDLHATVRVHNGTGSAVTIESVMASMTVASVKGSWLEKVGDRYNAEEVKFTPATVSPGTDTSLSVTIPSACTSGKYGTGVSSSADYQVTLHIATSAGAFSITAGNQHEIVAD